MNVFLIGYRATEPRPLTITGLDIEAIARRLRPTRTFVKRCAGREDFVDAVQRAGARRLVERLDILDIGAEGTQTMGDAVLWQSDARPGTPLIGRDLALAIEPYLSETAQIRLLGCNTAAGPAGRLLLLKLAHLLGPHRTVFGMIDRADEAHFDAEGYAPAMAPHRLFSSSAALEGMAPTVLQRVENLRAAGVAFL